MNGLSDAADTIQERLADYYMELAEQARREMFGPQRAAWMDRLEGESENLRAALRWLAERGEAARGLRLAVGLREFWWGGGHVSEGREWLATLLALPQAAERTILRAKALDDLGALAYLQNDYSTAHSLEEESLEIRRGVGDMHGVAVSLIHMGVNARDQGDYATARTRFEESLVIMRELGTRHGIVYSLCGLASVALDEGDYAAARPLLKEILPTLRERGDVWAISFQLDEWAGVAVGEGQPQRALRLAGAGAAMREANYVLIGPDYQAKLDRRIEPARTVLDESAQAAAWAEGRAMTLEEAVAYALEADG
jgi:tetratricopeptide (TPR) repeat protein